MRFSFLGKSFNMPMPTFEAFKTNEVVSVRGQSVALTPPRINQRQQQATLARRNTEKRHQAVNPQAPPKCYKTVAVHWLTVNHMPTSGSCSATAASQLNQPGSQEIEIKLPNIAKGNKLLLFVQAEATSETANSQVYKSRVVKIDQIAKTALIQVNASEGSPDWADKLKFKLVPVNSTLC
jgi:hypothetical protein